jgi:hypothetical protein
MIDLVPTGSQSSSVTACVRELHELKKVLIAFKTIFLRCILAAVLVVPVVSVLDLIINGIGIGWTYVLLRVGGSSILLLPLLYGATVIGLRCHIKRQHARDQESAQVAQLKDQLSHR